jgi:type IV pilus assembly protein PilB
MRASDLHFEPYEHHYRVRFRIDGELREIASPAHRHQRQARITHQGYLPRMDISEKRVPQDGRNEAQGRSGPRHRLPCQHPCPRMFGEKIVIRILDPSSAKLGIDALGL